MGGRNRLISTDTIRDATDACLYSPAAWHHKGLATYVQSAGREMMWQLRSQTCAEPSNSFHLLAPTAFRAKVRGAECRESNDPETEVWRSCQRSSTSMDRVPPLLPAG
jgi:hypothetical protein